MAEYIEKQAFNDAVREAIRRYPSTFYNGLETARRIAHDMDTADVQPVAHGEWIGYPECLKYENAYSDDHIICSACTACFSIIDNCTETFNYCPNCGARMDGGDTDER